ncbi:DUF2637 domain-containing protein [Solwaraspora sp. WMMD792]|uniref:DUF2637 domain-containing protein n=1 Tax=Solwaraspora sp. WMMD792 TaxID=3016099 RepID=UPI002417C532|nr:DUF2637 domain-containing protein [Solwaraspora sp. WMMD792]MDG4770692.1 DUF2637 domain-containing protein [Solwaraspora sp. WMMD792]
MTTNTHFWSLGQLDAATVWPLLAALLAGLVGVTIGAVAWRMIRRPSLPATTLASRGAAVVVALVAGYASWRHIADVARSAGEHGSVAVLLPLAVDGLILVGTMAMLDDKRHRRSPRWSARVALVFGVLATIAANIASAEPTTTARLVAAVPAVSFLLAIEVLVRSGKPITDPAPVVDEQPVSDDRADVPDPREHATPVADVPADPAPQRRQKAVRRARPKSLTAAQKVERAARALPAGTPEQIAARARVSERTARRYLPAASGPAPAETRVNGAALVDA